MWPMCTANSIWWLLLPLLIGLLTGWWAWARRPRPVYEAAPAARPVVATPEPVAAPVARPEPVVATPVALAAAEPIAPPPAPVMEAFPAPAVVAVAEPAPVRTMPVAPLAAVALTALGIPAAVGNPDDLLQLKGVGPKLNALLNSLGVFRFDQIAAWGAAEIGKVDGHLGSFKGRIVRDGWVEQAGLLARGAIADFEAKFGKLDSENR